VIELIGRRGRANLYRGLAPDLDVAPQQMLKEALRRPEIQTAQPAVERLRSNRP
jgi:hypothetical protein